MWFSVSLSFIYCTNAWKLTYPTKQMLLIHEAFPDFPRFRWFILFSESSNPDWFIWIVSSLTIILSQKHTILYKKGLNDPDNHDGVVTHLEPDILECEVKWALGSITTNKASGSDGIPAISNPKRWCWWVLTAFNMPANLKNSVVATGLEKVSFHSNPKERQCQRMLKLSHNCTHLTR